MDDYNISYLSVGREIFRDQIQPNRPPEVPLVIADTDFDLASPPNTPSSPPNISQPNVGRGRPLYPQG